MIAFEYRPLNSGKVFNLLKRQRLVDFICIIYKPEVSQIALGRDLTRLSSMPPRHHALTHNVSGLHNHEEPDNSFVFRNRRVDSYQWRERMVVVFGEKDRRPPVIWLRLIPDCCEAHIEVPAGRTCDEWKARCEISLPHIRGFLSPLSRLEFNRWFRDWLPDVTDFEIDRLSGREATNRESYGKRMRATQLPGGRKVICGGFERTEDSPRFGEMKAHIFLTCPVEFTTLIVFFIWNPCSD